LEKKYPSNN